MLGLSGLMRERRGIALGAGLAVIVAIAIGFLWGVGVVPGLNSGGSAAAQLPERAYTPADFWPEEQRVLHISGPDGEVWLDPRRGRARIEQRAGDGGLLKAAGVDGDVYWEYYDTGYMEDGSYRGNSGFLEIVRRTEPDTAWHRWVSLQGWYVIYHPFVRDEELRPYLDARERVIDGRTVLEVKVPFMSEDYEEEQVSTFYLDPDSGLFLDLVSEWLPVEAVDPALFATPEALPPLRSTRKDVQMTMEEARRFTDFDLYYLGPSVLDQPLLAVFEAESIYGADWSDPEKWPPSHSVQAAYGVPGPPGESDVTAVSITSWPDELVQAPWQEDPPMPRPGSPGREVTVAGVTGTLFEADNDTRLWFQLGDTVIMISGEDPEQILSAAESLEKLN